MEKRHDDEEQPKTSEEPPVTRDWGRQSVGALVGGAVVLIVGTIAKQMGWSGAHLTQYVLWGAVIGALFRSSESLERAGRTLTRRDEAWLNIVVALIGMTVVFAMFYAVYRGLLVLLRGLS